MEAHLLIIDPQRDFMDYPDSALPISGANDDMERLAKMIDRVGSRLADIHVTLDSHQVIHVGHGSMWRDKDGNMPDPFTIISSDDIKTGIWRPRNELAKPPELEGRTLGEFMLWYTQQLEVLRTHPFNVLQIWPEHCIIGTPGYDIQSDLVAVLHNWARREFANIDFVAKGTTTFVEHFGAYMAEVPLPTVPSTGLNASALDDLSKADVIGVGGEAGSHCVMSTVDQIAANIGEEHIAKFHILVDATSPVPQPPGGPNYPEILDEWFHAMEKRGMTLTTTEKFLA